MILSESEVEAIEARANAATEGPWRSDNQQDSEHRCQFYMALAPDGKSIFDTLNSSIAEIHEEADEDGVYRWDEIGRRNIAFASHARTDIPALCQTIQAAWAANQQIIDVIDTVNEEVAALRGKLTEVTAERDRLLGR